MGKAAQQVHVAARRVRQHGELQRRVPAGGRRSRPRRHHGDEDRRRAQRHRLPRVLRPGVRRSGGRSRSQRSCVGARGLRVRESESDADVPAEGPDSHRARDARRRRTRYTTRGHCVSRHRPNGRGARRRHERSRGQDARPGARRARAADRRVAPEESVDGRGRVRGRDGEAAHEPRGEDESVARSSAEEGPVVRRTGAIVLVLLAAGVSTAVAQRRGGFPGGGYGMRGRREPIEPNAPYDGQFTFVRMRYGPDYGYAAQSLPWSHDYPAGERHFMKIVNELSTLNPKTEHTNILTLDDPAIFHYPVLYLCEPGAWVMSDAEAAGFRAYIRKGGFVIVDDFRYQHWGNFQTQIS